MNEGETGLTSRLNNVSESMHSVAASNSRLDHSTDTKGKIPQREGCVGLGIENRHMGPVLG